MKPSGGRPSSLGPSFRRYWVGEALSNLGTRTAGVAYPLLALALTGSPAKAGLAAFVRSIPWFLFSLPTGALVDRLDRRRLMIWCDLGSFVAVGSLAAALATGVATYGALLASAFVQGLFGMAFRVAEVGAVRHLVERDSISTAVARNVARDSGAAIAGPPLGGLLFAIGRGLPFFVDAVSYLASAVTLATIPRPFHEPRERRPWSLRDHAREIGDGVRWIWRVAFLRVSELLVAGANFTMNALTLLLVVVLRDGGASPGQIGVMLGVLATGALLGAMAPGRLHRRVPPVGFVVGYGWVGVAVVGVVATVLRPGASGAVLAGWGFVGPPWDALVVGYRIRSVPEELQGRVESVSSLVSYGAAALGPLVAGVLATQLPTTAVFGCLAAVAVLVALAGTLARSALTPVETTTAADPPNAP